jgi:tetratricopeptide (TPR) repeat protein
LDFKLESGVRFWRQIVGLCCLLTPLSLSAAENEAIQYLKEAEKFYLAGVPFKAARYAFMAQDLNPALRPVSYAWLTVSLLKAGLPNAAVYFYIRTLQAKHPPSTKVVLGKSMELLHVVGPDLLRRYLVEFTTPRDYDYVNRSALYFALGKQALLSGQYVKAVELLSEIPYQSKVWPFALHLRGTALAVLNRHNEALLDFKRCSEKSNQIVFGSEKSVILWSEAEAKELQARCQVGMARTQYQMQDFINADRSYDAVPKGSMEWPPILFEHAWSQFALGIYNRALGKLVTYKSPALTFVYNPEIDVLRAQSYLALCTYEDANKTINEFHKKYDALGGQIKSFVEQNLNQIGRFYEIGRNTLKAPLQSTEYLNPVLNRFVRGPYFKRFVWNEGQIERERMLVRELDARFPGGTQNPLRGLPGFLDQVLQWRRKTIFAVGGAFVKNSLVDHYETLLEDYDKMSFIKLEMLKRAKDKLVAETRGEGRAEERMKGNILPSRRDDQYWWSFNGEFWNDELGDYVFGLESECTKGTDS